MPDDVDDNPAREALQFPQGFVMQGEQLAGTDEQLLTCRCQRHSPSGALEQWHADPFLEPPDATTERLLSDEESAGGASETQLLGDRYEVRSRRTSSSDATVLCSRLTPDTCTSPSVQPTRVHPSQPDQHLTGWSGRLRVGVEPEGGRVGFADP